MNNFGFAKDCERLKELTTDRTYKLHRDTSELVLLEQLIEVHRQHLKDKAKMVLV
jgi:hypothetical protein